MSALDVTPMSPEAKADLAARVNARMDRRKRFWRDYRRQRHNPALHLEARITRLGRWLDRWKHRRDAAAVVMADAWADGYKPSLAQTARYNTYSRAHDRTMAIWAGEWKRLRALRDAS